MRAADLGLVAAWGDVVTVAGLAGAADVDDDDERRLYAEMGALRDRVDRLSETVTREVTLAQQRRPMHDSQIADLRALAQNNANDLAEIKGYVRDLTTVVRVVRWGSATVAAGGAAAVVSLGGWWAEAREAFREIFK